MSDNISDRELLRLLKSAEGCLSGEVMAKKLNISRAAVWKRIVKLRNQGFVIDAQPKSGYRLLSSPDRLLPLMIKDGLKTILFGQEIYYFKETESTNKVAKKLANEGAEEGSIVIAEMQTGGRGRLNRKWVSPSNKNILMSVILRPMIRPAQAFSLTMLTSLAIVRAIKLQTGIKAKIKWPNDIYIGIRKTGGILTEFNAEHDRINFAIIGIGLNVNFNPDNYPEIKNISTSLSKELCEEISRIKLLQLILQEIEKGYNIIKEGDFARIHAEWNSCSLITGKRVKIISFNAVEEGVAEYVDADGCLIIKDDSGNKKKILCGDVSLRLGDWK